MLKIGLLGVTGGNAKQYSHSEKEFDSFLKIKKKNLSLDLAISLLCINPGERKLYLCKIHMFISTVLIIAPN